MTAPSAKTESQQRNWQNSCWMIRIVGSRNVGWWSKCCAKFFPINTHVSQLQNWSSHNIRKPSICLWKGFLKVLHDNYTPCEGYGSLYRPYSRNKRFPCFSNFQVLMAAQKPFVRISRFCLACEHEQPFLLGFLDLEPVWQEVQSPQEHPIFVSWYSHLFKANTRNYQTLVEWTDQWSLLYLEREELVKWSLRAGLHYGGEGLRSVKNAWPRHGYMRQMVDVQEKN